MNTNWLEEPIENGELKQFKKDLNTLIECIYEITKNNWNTKERYEEFKKNKNGLSLFKKLYSKECDLFLKRIEDRPNGFDQLIELKKDLEQVESILEEKDILKSQMPNNYNADWVMSILMSEKEFIVIEDDGVKKVFHNDDFNFSANSDYPKEVKSKLYLVNFNSLKDYLLNLEEVRKNRLLWTKINYPYNFEENYKSFKKDLDHWSSKSQSSHLIRTPLLEKFSHYHLNDNHNEKEIKQEIENIKKDVKQIVEETNLNWQHVIGYEQIDFDEIWSPLEKHIHNFFNNYDLSDDCLNSFKKWYLKDNCKETKMISKDEKERVLNKVFGVQKVNTLEM